MRTTSRLAASLLALLTAGSLRLLAAEPAPSNPAPTNKDALPTVATKAAGMERREGLLTFYVDPQRGKVWLEVPAPTAGAKKVDGEFGRYLYVEGLVSGLGSASLGLDRGQMGDSRIVRLRRVGGRILVEEGNDRFRALSDDADQRRAAEESFPTSVLWGGEVAAEDAGGRALVDFTSFLTRDAHGIQPHLKASGQGSWSIDSARSAVEVASCFAFPENDEFESVLTYTSQDSAPGVRAIVPMNGVMTVVQHQAFVRLPDDGYRPRSFDARMGSFGVAFSNYTAPLGAPIDTRYLVRYRLEKVDPTAARSRVKKPIVYYVDRGAPEPVRSALVEGASWWKEAFDRAGFIDAFRVELLPEGANPLDVRYPMIQWVHRATRGWSYGGGIIDPRTGEMLKGHVTLGSLRIRQDVLLFEGLSGADRTGKGGPDDSVTLSLARIRQLAAHEVGHSLGFAHNFAASTYGRASVMDYPAPWIKVNARGELDFSQAYATGIGEWDIESVRYAYSQFAPGADEAHELDSIALDAQHRGLLFLSDQDARPPGAAQPLANLWDNGNDPVKALEDTLAVRKIALAHFGAHNIAAGQPLAFLQEVLVPVYLHHRYQLDAALKVIGGLDYSYAVRGEGKQEASPLDPSWQRRALTTVLSTIHPEALDLPEPVVRLLLPRPAEYGDNIEMFRGDASPAFDPLAAAATAADMTVSGLLQPERDARLIDFHRRDAALPSFEEVLGALTDAAFGAPKAADTPRQAEIRRTVQAVVVSDLLRTAANPDSSPGVRSRVDAELRRLRSRLGGTKKAAVAAAGESAERSQRQWLSDQIDRWLERRASDAGKPLEVPALPPGQPIGSGSMATPQLAGCSWED